MPTLYSARYYNGGSSCLLNGDIIHKLAGRSKRISILSAYYSIKFLTSIIEAIPEKRRQICSIQLVLNGFADPRLDDQKKELEKFVKGAKKALMHVLC